MLKIALRPALIAMTFLSAWAGGAIAKPAAEDSRLLPYTKPGRMVDIGGRRINLQCSGAGVGGPTVILMAGSSSWSAVWYKVQPRIAETTQVCAFDRAAYGFSDPPPQPEIMSDVADDLHAALTAAHVPAPYVLVGHSLGGVEARLYAQSWPREVAAMVLVDTSPAGEMLIEAQQPGYDEALGREKDASKMLKCVLLAAHGPLPQSSPDYKGCSIPLPDETPAALRAIFPNFFTAEHAATELSLFSSLYTTRYNSIDHRSLGAMPLVVLSADGTWDIPTPAGVRFKQHYLKTWFAQHEALAHLSTRGVHRIIKGSGHEIQLDKPEAVIDAVDQVLRQLR